MGGTAWVVPFLFFFEENREIDKRPHPHGRSRIKEERPKFM